jgi:hypothetical protein
VKEMRFRTFSFWAFFSACMVGQGERASERASFARADFFGGCSGKSFMFTTLRTKQDEPPGKLTEHFE